MMQFGRGAKKELRSATATTGELIGRLNMRVLNGGAATLHSIRVHQPKQVHEHVFRQTRNNYYFYFYYYYINTSCNHSIITVVGLVCRTEMDGSASRLHSSRTRLFEMTQHHRACMYKSYRAFELPEGRENQSFVCFLTKPYRRTSAEKDLSFARTCG